MPRRDLRRRLSLSRTHTARQLWDSALAPPVRSHRHGLRRLTRRLRGASLSKRMAWQAPHVAHRDVTTLRCVYSREQGGELLLRKNRIQIEGDADAGCLAQVRSNGMVLPAGEHDALT